MHDQKASLMTLDSRDRWLENGDIVIDADKIIALGHDLSDHAERLASNSAVKKAYWGGA